MKVSSVNISPKVAVQNYRLQKKYDYTTKNNITAANEIPNFKSNKSTLIGMATGALAGAGLAALVIATGGLAAAVAAVGTLGVTTASAGIGSEIGGIIGGLAKREHSEN